MLRHGNTGPDVTQLQRQLAGRGHEVVIDGWFGDETERAVRQFQAGRGLVSDGIVGPKTRAAIENLNSDKLLGQSDLQRAADELGVQVAAVMATNEIESRGIGFLGREAEPVILYERHIMYRRLAEHGYDAEPIALRHSDIVNRTPGGYQGGLAEHRRLERASAIDRACALESCSWGLFQIMGYHWERLGYASVEAFVERMKTSEAEHLAAFVRFIQADPRLHRALKARRWTDFARIYNGPAYWRNDYDTKLAGAYRRHSQAA